MRAVYFKGFVSTKPALGLVLGQEASSEGPMRLLATILILLAAVSAHTAAAERTNAPTRVKVFVAADPAATTAFVPNASAVRRMVDRGLLAVSGKDSHANAWREFVGTNDVVGFKVTSAPGALIGTRLPVVEALVTSLIEAGHPKSKIIIWDREARDLKTSGYESLAARLGVRAAASTDAGWDGQRSYESPYAGKLVYGDLEFGGDRFAVGRKSHVTKLLSREITKIITVAPVLSHNGAGINGHLASLALGSMDNIHRFDEPVRVAEALPEICALDDLMPKVAFGVTDALVCQVRGDETARLHDTVALNEIRFSTDLVALDVIALGDIATARKAYPIEGEKPFKTDLYVNAEILELGIADIRRIDLERVP